jgi:rubrerythrin
MALKTRGHYRYFEDDDGVYTCETCGHAWRPEWSGRRCPRGCEDRAEVTASEAPAEQSGEQKEGLI